MRKSQRLHLLYVFWSDRQSPVSALPLHRLHWLLQNRFLPSVHWQAFHLKFLYHILQLMSADVPALSSAHRHLPAQALLPVQWSAPLLQHLLHHLFQTFCSFSNLPPNFHYSYYFHWYCPFPFLYHHSNPYGFHCHFRYSW